MATAELDTDSVTVKYRVFAVGPYSFTISRSGSRDKMRAGAQQAIADQIGAVKVISISEHADPWGAFSVVVWYRASS